MLRLLAILLACVSVEAMEAPRDPIYRIVGERDGQLFVQRNGGPEISISDFGPGANSLIWQRLSTEDRTRMVAHYSWDIGRRKAEMGAATSDEMATFINGQQGWSDLVQAKMDAHAAKTWPELTAFFATRPDITMPTDLDPNVAQSLAAADLAALHNRIMADWEAGKVIFEKMRDSRWDQVGVAVKGISGPLIKVVMDNLGGGFTGLRSTRASVEALRDQFNELRQKLTDWQLKKKLNLPDADGEAAGLIAQIQDQLDRMESTASEISTGLVGDLDRYRSNLTRLLEDNAAAVAARQQRAATINQTVETTTTTAQNCAPAYVPPPTGETDQEKLDELVAQIAALTANYHSAISSFTAAGNAATSGVGDLDWGMDVYYRVNKLGHALVDHGRLNILDPNHDDPDRAILRLNASKLTSSGVEYGWVASVELTVLADPDNPLYNADGMPDDQCQAIANHLNVAANQIRADDTLLQSIGTNSQGVIDSYLPIFEAILAEVKGIDAVGQAIPGYGASAHQFPIPTVANNTTLAMLTSWISLAANRNGYADEVIASIETAKTGVNEGRNRRQTRVREALNHYDTARINFLNALSAAWDKLVALDAHQAADPYSDPDSSFSTLPGIGLSERLTTLYAYPANEVAARTTATNTMLTQLKTAAAIENNILHDLACLQNATLDALAEAIDAQNRFFQGIALDVDSRYRTDWRAISGIDFVSVHTYAGYGNGTWTGGSFTRTASNSRSTIQSGIPCIAGLSTQYLTLVDLTAEVRARIPALALLDEADYRTAWNAYSHAGYTQYMEAFDDKGAINHWPASDQYVELLNALEMARRAWDAAHEVPPELTITPNAETVHSSPIVFTITASEDLIGLDADDVSISGGTLNSFTGFGSEYTATVTPTAAGTVSISIAAGGACTADDYADIRATQASVSYVPSDTNLIGVVISPDGIRAPAQTFSFSIEFASDVTGFDSSDLILQNATLGGLTGSGRYWQAQVTATGSGQVSLALPPHAAVASNGDFTAPAVAIVEVPSPPLLWSLAQAYTDGSGVPAVPTPADLGLRSNELLHYNPDAAAWQVVATNDPLEQDRCYVLTTGFNPVDPPAWTPSPLTPGPLSLRQGWNLCSVREACSLDALQISTSDGETAFMGNDGADGLCARFAWMVDPMTGAYVLVVPTALAANIPGAVSSIPANATVWVFQTMTNPPTSDN